MPVLASPPRIVHIPHFVRWGEIYPILGPQLNFFGAALTMTLIASPIPPDRRYRPVQEADIHAPVPTLSLAKTHAPNMETHRTRGRQRRVAAATIRGSPRYSGGVSYWRGGHRGASLSAPMIEVQGTPKWEVPQPPATMSLHRSLAIPADLATASPRLARSRGPSRSRRPEDPACFLFLVMHRLPGDTGHRYNARPEVSCPTTSTRSARDYAVPVNLRASRTRHELGDRRLDVEFGVEHAGQRCGDGHVHALPLGHCSYDACGPDALGHHAELAKDVGEETALRQPEAHAIVARVSGGARDHEIAHPGEASQRQEPRAPVDREAADLRHSAGHQQTPRVLAQPEPGDGPGRDRDDVLERPPELDPNHVIVGVHPKAGPSQSPLSDADDLRIAACHNRGGRQSRQDLRGDVGTAQDPELPDRRFLAHDPGHGPSRPLLEPLDRVHDDLVG